MKKSRILISLLVMALSAALIGGATMAWFTDSANSAPVTMTAGTLLISINDFVLEGVEEGLSVDNMNPGDVQDASFVVTNDGTKNLQFIGYLCWKDIIGQLNDDLGEEMKALLVEKGYGDGELSDVLNFKISVRGATWDYFNLGEGVFYNDTLPETGPFEFGLAELAPGASLTYDVEITLPGPETGNAYQGSEINLAFGVVAGQTTNNAPAPTLEGIVCPFAEEPVPVIVSRINLGIVNVGPAVLETYGTLTGVQTFFVSYEGFPESGIELTLDFGITGSAKVEVYESFLLSGTIPGYQTSKVVFTIDGAPATIYLSGLSGYTPTVTL